MNRYTIYCTEEQTKKALELGAPILKSPILEILRNEINVTGFILDNSIYWYPTAEQMISWLEEKGFYFHINTYGAAVEIDFKTIYEDHNKPHKEAILAAIDAALNIDAALEYLKNNKN